MYFWSGIGCKFFTWIYKSFSANSGIANVLHSCASSSGVHKGRLVRHWLQGLKACSSSSRRRRPQSEPRHSLRPRTTATVYNTYTAEKYSLAQQRNTALQNREIQCACTLGRQACCTIQSTVVKCSRLAAQQQLGIPEAFVAAPAYCLPACLPAPPQAAPRLQTSRLHLVELGPVWRSSLLNAVVPVHLWFSPVGGISKIFCAFSFLLFDIEGLLYLWPVVQRFSVEWKCVQNIL